MLPEYPGKVNMVRISAQSPYLSHRGVGDTQQVLGLLNPQGGHQLTGRKPHLLHKSPVKGRPAESGLLYQKIHRYRLQKMAADIGHSLTDHTGMSGQTAALMLPEQL